MQGRRRSRAHRAVDPTRRLLRTIHDPPIVLYVWGELNAARPPAIGVVGSRQTSFYGTETAKKLSYQLAYAGLTVFSGLARGIDTAAHQGALAAKGRTVAVLGCGLSQIYPPENFGLAESIADGTARLFRSSPWRVAPDRQTFPMRNRIISGCSLGPAGRRGGAEQRRAHQRGPGARAGSHGVRRARPDRPARRPQGSNRLIQQGAKLVMEARISWRNCRPCRIASAASAPFGRSRWRRRELVPATRPPVSHGIADRAVRQLKPARGRRLRQQSTTTRPRSTASSSNAVCQPRSSPLPFRSRTQEAR